MQYAEYEKLDTELDKKISKSNKCMYRKRDYNFHSNKCPNTISNLNYIIDKDSVDKCKLIYNNRIDSNVVSYKNDKQLFPAQ